MQRRRADRDLLRPSGCDGTPSVLEDDSPDAPLYWYEGECLGCGEVSPLTDRDLCTGCDACFDRDLIRLRQWDLSSLAEGVPEEGREALRRRVTDEHGGALELLEPRVADEER